MVVLSTSGMMGEKKKENKMTTGTSQTKVLKVDIASPNRMDPVIVVSRIVFCFCVISPAD